MAAKGTGAPKRGEARAGGKTSLYQRAREDRARLFVAHWLSGGQNGVEAARAAGYKGSAASLRVMASRLLRRADVRAELEKNTNRVIDGGYLANRRRRCYPAPSKDAERQRERVRGLGITRRSSAGPRQCFLDREEAAMPRHTSIPNIVLSESEALAFIEVVRGFFAPPSGYDRLGAWREYVRELASAVSQRVTAFPWSQSETENLLWALQARTEAEETAAGFLGAVDDELLPPGDTRLEVRDRQGRLRLNHRHPRVFLFEVYLSQESLPLLAELYALDLMRPEAEAELNRRAHGQVGSWPVIACLSQEAINEGGPSSVLENNVNVCLDNSRRVTWKRVPAVVREVLTERDRVQGADRETDFRTFQGTLDSQAWETWDKELKKYSFREKLLKGFSGEFNFLPNAVACDLIDQARPISHSPKLEPLDSCSKAEPEAPSEIRRIEARRTLEKLSGLAPRERELLSALMKAEGDVAKAAESLGVTRSTADVLLHRIRQKGLKRQNT